MKFPLLLREVICPRQLQSVDPLAANLLFEDRHFLRVALRVLGRAPVEVAVDAGLAGNPPGEVLLVVVPTLLREQCFAVSQVLDVEGLAARLVQLLAGFAASRKAVRSRASLLSP